jgi:hypothetical protein
MGIPSVLRARLDRIKDGRITIVQTGYISIALYPAIPGISSPDERGF